MRLFYEFCAKETYSNKNIPIVRSVYEFRAKETYANRNGRRNEAIWQSQSWDFIIAVFSFLIYDLEYRKNISYKVLSGRFLKRKVPFSLQTESIKQQMKSKMR